MSLEVIDLKKILITMKVPEKTLELLKNEFSVEYNDSYDFLPKNILKEKIKDVDGVLIPLSEKIDKEIIDASNNLKIIANFGAGFDNIDIKYAKEKNIIVTNAPAKGSTNSTAELTFGLIIDLLRGITSGEKSLRKGKFKGWKPTYGLGPTLEGKTLGIFGMGRIGKRVSHLANAFDMKIIYNSRTRLSEDEEKNLNVKYVDFDTLLKESDVLTLHSSYNKELHHLIGLNELKKMKENSYLVNASRGPIINEKELAEALKNDVIVGAALDVYEFEPNVTKDLLELNNVLLSPHLGNATIEAREEMGDIAAKNIIEVLNGREPLNKVN